METLITYIDFELLFTAVLSKDVEEKARLIALAIDLPALWVKSIVQLSGTVSMVNAKNSDKDAKAVAGFLETIVKDRLWKERERRNEETIPTVKEFVDSLRPYPRELCVELGSPIGLMGKLTGGSLNVDDLLGILEIRCSPRVGQLIISFIDKQDVDISIKEVIIGAIRTEKVDPDQPLEPAPSTVAGTNSFPPG